MVCVRMGYLLLTEITGEMEPGDRLVSHSLGTVVCWCYYSFAQRSTSVGVWRGDFTVQHTRAQPQSMMR